MYVARILPPVVVGEVAYAQNIVSYFSILAFLGIPTYGMREIAKARNNHKELCKLFSELFILNFFSTVFFSILYYVLIFTVPDFQRQLLLHIVVGITVILNMLNISWLFDGLEEFRYVSIRNGFFKFLMFFLLLLVVRTPDDMIPYAFITVLGVAGNNLVNVIYSKKFIKYQFHGLCFSRHMRSIFMLVMVNLAIEIYSLVGTTLLGFLSTKESVAFFSYADKTNKILLQITNTVTMVLVPRIAFYYGQGKLDEFNQLLTKALKVLVLMAVPMIILIEFTADFLFPHVFGTLYIHSAYVEQILCFVLLIAPTGYLLGSRVLLVSRREEIMVFCVTAGAIVSVISNYFLIQLYGEIGAAMATVFSELVVAVLYINFGRKEFSLLSLKKNFINIGLSTVVMSIFLLVMRYFCAINWVTLFIQITGAVLLYAMSLRLLKDSVFCDYSNRVFNRVCRRKCV